MKNDPFRAYGGLTRRTFLTGAGSLLLLGAAGCGSGGSGGGSGSSSETRTVEHKYGTTEIEGSPERVVSIGFTDQDFIYALGVSPIAVRYWYGDEDDVIQPWTEDLVEGERPEVLEMPDGLNFEKIASLEPDLVIGAYSGITKDEFETLSEIAPTVAQSGDYIDYGMPWQETTTIIGQALGRARRAGELVSDVESQFEDLSQQNPQFEGKSLAIGTYSGGTFGVFASEDPRSRFFRSLGFEIPEEFDQLAGDQFYADLSAERVDLLETDVLVWDQLSFTEGGRRTVEELPLIEQLDVMRDGRAIFLEDEIELAFGWQTILSLPFALEGIAPMLAEVTKN